ncbi:hypothetical protein Bca101_021328 [Brassica carinata]
MIIPSLPEDCTRINKDGGYDFKEKEMRNAAPSTLKLLSSITPQPYDEEILIQIFLLFSRRWESFIPLLPLYSI